ncbi:hypothetical protein MKW98_023275 [Papaver atlanticum]|uniref:IBR domain-containing protein n=1 Tax=Papaver atlanticum TaxID=357466 RepID=A0AAD4T9V6_9MAGN|nr:hypothetical protein MKW98_023275 [Papaver atlanticum]
MEDPPQEQKLIRCPSCNHYIERNEGISTSQNITCSCGTNFCQHCGSVSCVCERKWSLWWIPAGIFMWLGTLILGATEIGWAVEGAGLIQL